MSNVNSTTSNQPIPRLPESMQEFIRVLGYESAMRLVAEFGGITLSGKNGAAKTRTGGIHRMLESVLNHEEINKLIAWAGAEQLYIPRCAAAMRARRDTNFANEFNHLLDGGMSGRKAMAQLCPRYGFSDRHGWDVMRRWRENAS